MLLSKVDGIDLWKDPPYMLGGVEIPGIDYGAGDEAGTDLGAPDLSLTLDKPLLPDRYTNRYEIKIDGMIGDDVTCYRYMRMNIPLEEEDSFSVYCWITDVVRNAATAPACVIRYEIDYWRTYLPKLSFGRGEVTRCGIEEFKRPYSLQPRHRKMTGIIPLNATGNSVTDGTDRAAVWVIVLYVKTIQLEPKITHIRKAFFPLDNSWSGGSGFFFKEGTGYFTPTSNSVYGGGLEEDMGLDPDSIIAVYISPICPSSGLVYWDDQLGDSGGWNAGLAAVGGTTGCGWMEEEQTYSAPETFLLGDGLGNGITADDMTSYAVTGMQGEILGFLPYGVNVTSVSISVDCGAAGAYLHIAFVSDISPNTPQVTPLLQIEEAGPKFAAAVGLAFTAPLLSIPVTSNSMSSYAYSGQRDYDIETAKIARDQNLVNGLTGVINGGASGGLMGSLIKQSIKSAGIGALAGAAASAGAAGIQYAIQGRFDDRLQDAKDALFANQSPNLILSGGSRYYVVHSQFTAQKNLHGACIIALTMDEVSAAEYEKDIELNGYETQIAAEDVTPFVQYGGPLRIENMKIGGEDVPYLAIASIKDMFSRGVFIINPPEEEEP